MSDSTLPPATERLRFRAVDRAAAAIQRTLALDPAVLSRIFTRLDSGRVMAEAKAIDEDSARSAGPLSGLLVSIKDLFDEAGETTTAGSRILGGGPKASGDAEAVRRLKAAGALPFGRTTMSEFAYSGVGLNPHFGDPGNARDAMRITGGSTSGGVLTVALGLVDAALGSDTGGSVRIPAALNGVCGYKPTHGLIPLTGAFPLSSTYDSIGPIGRDMTVCARIHSVLSQTPMPTRHDRPLRLGIVRELFTDDLDETVANAFEDALRRLSEAGLVLAEASIEHLRSAGPANRVIVSSEAYPIHSERLARLEEVGDTRVLKRIRAAEGFAPGEEADARAVRATAARTFAAHDGGFDAFLAPTIPVVAPLIADATADFDRLNALMLRNPSVINFLDGCAASIPMGRPGDLPSGLTIFGPAGTDAGVIAAALQAETAMRRP